MYTTSEVAIRELDHRTNDGIDVTLLWHSQTNGVFVAVQDQRSGELFELEIHPVDALAAFHHPYGYLRPGCGDQTLAV